MLEVTVAAMAGKAGTANARETSSPFRAEDAVQEAESNVRIVFILLDS